MTRLRCLLLGHDWVVSHQTRLSGQAFADWHNDRRLHFGWPTGSNGCYRCGEVWDMEADAVRWPEDRARHSFDKQAEKAIWWIVLAFGTVLVLTPFLLVLAALVAELKGG